MERTTINVELVVNLDPSDDLNKVFANILNSEKKIGLIRFKGKQTTYTYLRDPSNGTPVVQVPVSDIKLL